MGSRSWQVLKSWHIYPIDFTLNELDRLEGFQRRNDRHHRHILKVRTGCGVEIRVLGFKGRKRKIRKYYKSPGEE